MAITSPMTYLPAVDSHIAHWQGTDPALTLLGGYTLADFMADRDALQELENAIIAQEATHGLAATQRDMEKAALRPALTRFRAAVTNALDGTPHAAHLPKLPALTSLESRYLRPFDDMADRWAALDALPPTPLFAPPLVLGDGTTLAEWQARLDGMRERYRAVQTAADALALTRLERLARLPPLRARLRQYRAAVVNRFGPDSPQFASLPRLSRPYKRRPKPATSGTMDPS